MIDSKLLPQQADVLAPDGSEVRLLASCPKGSMAHFTLLPNQISTAVEHQSVDELWFVVSGEGRMWRSNARGETITQLVSGQSLSIPVGTVFQFRCDGTEPLRVVGVTMPPWPGMNEAMHRPGKW